MPRIEAISVTGFKSFRDRREIDLRLITVLAGPNSSGKSTFMQPLLLIKQTQEEQANYGPLFLSGPQVGFTNYRELFWRNGAGSEPPTFSLGIKVNDGQPYTWKEQCYELQKGREGREGTDDEIALSWSDFSARKGDDIEHWHRKRSEKIRLMDLPDAAAKLLGKLGRDVSQDIELEVTPEKGFMVYGQPPRGSQFWTPYRWNPMHLLDELVRNLIYLPGLRGNPAREYQLALLGSPEKGVKNYPGSFLTYVAGLLYYWKMSTDTDESRKLEQLKDYLIRLQFTSGLEVERISNTAAKISVQRGMTKGSDKGDLVNIADVGLGLSQTLPVLVALLAADANSVVHIEQPEIHLHPLAQRELAKIIGETVKSSTGAPCPRVVIETHSPLLILGLQTLVAEGKLDSSDISLNWLSRDPEFGFTTVTAAELDDRGRFGDWPADFDEVSWLADRDYLAAQMKAKGDEHRED